MLSGLLWIIIHFDELLQIFHWHKVLYIYSLSTTMLSIGLQAITPAMRSTQPNGPFIEV